MNIESLVGEFESLTLPRAAWTHQAHMAVALWYLRRDPYDMAVSRLRAGIQRYNVASGHPRGYHETITLAWCAIIASFLETHDRGQPAEELLSKLVEQCGAPDYLLRFYSRERLMSEAARSEWQAPDLARLPGAGW